MIQFADAFWSLRSNVHPESSGSGPASNPRPSSPEGMFHCLYCDQDKLQAESTVEHAIPQFLGGAHAPPHYKLRNVCIRCNNVLGLHVDASYARSWNVTNDLAMAARKLYAGPGESPLPLVYMGLLVDIPGMNVPPEMVVELWLGPSGETIVWIRSNNDLMYWYSGGHPIDKKNKPSTLYYMPTAADPVRFLMGMEAFNAAFKKAKARRIFGAELVGAPTGALYPGFDAPTVIEFANLQAVRQANALGNFHVSAAVNIRFDDRFICKMVLAVGYSLFGEPFLATETAEEARLGLWPNQDQQPRLRGVGSWMKVSDKTFSSVTGYPGAVSILVMRTGSCYAMSVNVDQKMPFTVELAPEKLHSSRVPEYGYAMLLFPQLRQAIELDFPTMITHKLGRISHPELARVDAKARQAERFNETLPALPRRAPAPSGAPSIS